MTDNRSLFTFLFTDVEGSSRLWEEDSDAMAAAMARHDTLLSEVFSGHGGHVFKMMGDSVCVAFTRVEAALSAVIDAQRSLVRESWETPRPLRVRAALHKGAAEMRNSDYFGPTLNRTARLLAAGHGEQTLLSRAAQENLALPDGVSLRDLGERRLRDLISPEHVFQLLAPGLREDFPPLRSLEALPNNLPAQVNPFIGREKDLAELKKLIGQSRLVTLTGPGGAGKTRLSLQAAAELLENFLDGVWLAELATVAQADAVIGVVASALGLREEAGRPLEDTLVGYLREKNVLLLLDNCEHVIAATATLSDHLLRAAPRLRILASSREAMSIAGEVAYPVQSLTLPDFSLKKWTAQAILERAGEFEAVRLFVERAAAVQPGFALTVENALIIAKICWRLDGIPLAIELAAARVRALSLEQIYQRLDDRFHLLTGGGRNLLPRQQTLTALIDWSYELLTEKERLLLQRVSVFGRGRTLKALEAVCSGEGIEEWEVLDLLQQLIDKSLLSAEQSDFVGLRYFVLESVWDYARAKLDESGDADRMRDRHLDYFLKMAEISEPKLMGPDQSTWLEKLTTEHVNLRLALRWTAESPGAVERGLRLAGSLWRYWEVRGHLQEGYEHCAALVALPISHQFPAAREKALICAGRLSWCRDLESVSRGHLLEALDLARQLGDERGAALLHAQLGFVEWSDLQTDAASAYFAKAVEYAEQHDDKMILAMTKSGLGSVARRQGDFQKARELKAESLANYRSVEDTWIVALICFSIANLAMDQRDYEAVRSHLAESAAIAEQLGNEWLFPAILEILGNVALETGHALHGATIYGAADVLRDRLGLPPPANERQAYDGYVERMKAGLSAEDFASAWAAGRAMTPELALRFAELPGLR